MISITRICIYVKLGFSVLSCDFNMLEPGVDASSVEAKIEQAKIEMDNKEYDSAVRILSKLQSDAATDSNDIRILHAAAKLGQSQLDVWSIITRVIEDQSSLTTGVNEIFGQISDTVLGTGAEKERRITSLNESIQLLTEAPDQNDTRPINIACLLAGILTVPISTDAQTILTGVNPALQEVQSSVIAGGGQCDAEDTAPLAETLASIDSILDTINLVVDLIPQCTIFNLAGTGQNSVESFINNIRDNADQGCQTPDCQGCDLLFPSCVTETIGTSNGTASDGQIARCELVLNCYQPNLCFN